MRISDWSSDVCSSDLLNKARDRAHLLLGLVIAVTNLDEVVRIIRGSPSPVAAREALLAREWPVAEIAPFIRLVEAIEHEVEGETYKLSDLQVRAIRSEEHKSELQSLMRISYAVFWLK